MDASNEAPGNVPALGNSKDMTELANMLNIKPGDLMPGM